MNVPPVDDWSPGLFLQALARGDEVVRMQNGTWLNVTRVHLAFQESIESAAEAYSMLCVRIQEQQQEIDWLHESMARIAMSQPSIN